MRSTGVDIEFGMLTRCGEVLRAEMGVADGACTFADLFARAMPEDRHRLVCALHRAVLVTGSLDETLDVDGSSYRVSGTVAHDRPGVVEGTCSPAG